MGVCTKERKGVAAEVLMATPCTNPPAYLKVHTAPTIFWEMVKFVALGVLYFSLVLPL